jgi:hypothetical protein
VRYDLHAFVVFFLCYKIHNMNKKALPSILMESVLISNTTELNPREAAIRSAIQEFPKLLCNHKVHYRIHKSPSPVPILSQINQDHTTPSHFSKIDFNIVLPPTFRFSCWAFSRNPVYIYLLPSSVLHAPAHLILLDRISPC